MRALFLADAHLYRPEDPNYQTLLRFLEDQTGKLDLLVLLGDIFEFWAGDRDTLHASYVPLIERLEKIVSAGTRLIYVEGNHDYDMGRQFTERLNCRVLPDGGILELNGRKVFLAHGDQANPADRGYHFLRWFLRTPVMRFLTRHLPESVVWWIAERSVQGSRKSTHEKSRRWPAREILVPYAQQILSGDCSVVITGHYHQAFREPLEGGELIALGDWIEQYSYLVYENGAFELRSYLSAESS